MPTKSSVCGVFLGLLLHACSGGTPPGSNSRLEEIPTGSLEGKGLIDGGASAIDDDAGADASITDPVDGAVGPDSGEQTGTRDGGQTSLCPAFCVDSARCDSAETVADCAALGCGFECDEPPYAGPAECTIQSGDLSGCTNAFGDVDEACLAERSNEACAPCLARAAACIFEHCDTICDTQPKLTCQQCRADWCDVTEISGIFPPQQRILCQ